MPEFCEALDSHQDGSCMPMQRVLAALGPRLSELQRHA